MHFKSVEDGREYSRTYRVSAIAGAANKSPKYIAHEAIDGFQMTEAVEDGTIIHSYIQDYLTQFLFESFEHKGNTWPFRQMACATKIENRAFVFKPEERPEPDMTFAAKKNKAWINELEQKAVELGMPLYSYERHQRVKDAAYFGACEIVKLVHRLRPKDDSQLFSLLIERKLDAAIDQVDNVKITGTADLVFSYHDGPDVVIDIKTCGSQGHWQSMRSIENWGYDLQVSAYARMIELQRPDLVEGSVKSFIVFVPRQAPYDVFPVEIPRTRNNEIAFFDALWKYHKVVSSIPEEIDEVQKKLIIALADGQRPNNEPYFTYQERR